MGFTPCSGPPSYLAQSPCETLFGYAPGELNGVTAGATPIMQHFWRWGRAYPVIHQGEIFAGEVELARNGA